MARFKALYADPRGVNDEKYLVYYAAARSSSSSGFGVHRHRRKDGFDIAGDARVLPIPDVFEGEGDTAFIKEAQRVLRPGGFLLIVPLELAGEYSIETHRCFAPFSSK